VEDTEHIEDAHQSQTHYIAKHDYDITQILNSKIYDDEDKQSVRYRYRYILYFPCMVYCVLGIVCLVLRDTDYIYLLFGYPVLQIALSIVLWCQIDIVILSCGGAHIVEECLEVQISANGDEYKCIYCCWCDCAVLRFCNSCTFDNGFSLFKCHHKFLKVLICLICPLLTSVYYIIAEFHQIYHPLIETKIGFLNEHNASPQWLQAVNDWSVYWLIFIIVSVLYIILMFTATYIGILIVKSLHHISSLKPKTLSLQYLTSIILTFIMQIQFVVLLLYYNIWREDECDLEHHHHEGLCSAMPFYMILVYIEFIIASILNHFSFKNSDFERFGREAITENKVLLFDFKPEFEKIHDLHNYRRIYGEKFLWDLDHRNVPFLSSQEYVMDHDDDEQQPLTQKQRKRKKKKKRNEEEVDIELESVVDGDHDVVNKQHTKSMPLNPIKDQQPTTTMTTANIEELRDEMIINNGKQSVMDDHYKNSSLSLSFQNATLTQTTMKETGHHHPTTTTSLSLDLHGHYGSDSRDSSFSSEHHTKHNKSKRSRAKSAKSKKSHDKLPKSKKTKLLRKDSEIP